MALLERILEVTFRKANGNFVESDTDTLTLKGNRIAARITKAGGPSMNRLDLDVFGMTLSEMNQLMTLGVVVQFIPRNEVVVRAGTSEDESLSLVFAGNVVNAWADFQSAPQVPFHVESQTGIALAVSAAEPSSFKGPVDVVTALESLATAAGLNFENNGVDVKLPTTYASGSRRNQIYKIAKDAGININMDDFTLAIWPKNSAREGTVPLISVDTGMVGYPSYTPYGLFVKTVYNPAIGFGSKVEVQSSLKPASRVWHVNSLEHHLDSRLPGGDWFSMVGCYDPNFPVNPS